MSDEDVDAPDLDDLVFLAMPADWRQQVSEVFEFGRIDTLLRVMEGWLDNGCVGALSAFAAAGPKGYTIQCCYEDGQLSAHVVDLPGCFATGTTWGELGSSLAEGIRLYLDESESRA